MRNKDIRNWSLIAGAVLIAVACLVAYFQTKPAEADLARLLISAYFV